MMQIDESMCIIRPGFVTNTASSTYIERFTNIPIREEVDQDDCGNDHTNTTW
jgi:hypothetical protein